MLFFFKVSFFSESGCPYSIKNLNKYHLPDRILLQTYNFESEPKSNVDDISINTNVSTRPYQKIKLKRGRPCKKIILSGKIGTINENKKPIKKSNKKTNQLEKRIKYEKKLKKEIRESVYLTKIYNTTDIFKTVGFKVDSKLVYGNYLELK